MSEGAISDFGKMAITLRRIEGFGSNFVDTYFATHQWKKTFL